MARRLLLLAVLIALNHGAPARAQSDVGEEDYPRWRDRCAAGSSDSHGALTELATIRELLQRASNRADLEVFVRALDELMSQPCFETAALVAEPATESLPQLRAWWDEGGYGSLLGLAAGVRPGQPVEVIVPPDPRPVLSTESSRQDHPLHRLLCSEADPDCGRETAGWIVRAEAAFEAHALRERVRFDEEDAFDDPIDSDDCARQVRSTARSQRYLRWLECVTAIRPREAALPVGRIRAPTTGHLVVFGRRGHYEFCDEHREYDLATGEANVESMCSELVLREGGSVDRPATLARARDASTIGRVALDAIREAAWMLLLGTEATESHGLAECFELPRSVPTRVLDDGSRYLGGIFGGALSSAQTRLTWAWVVDGETVIEGRLTWPESSSAIDDHAAALLRVAEAGLERGTSSGSR